MPTHNKNVLITGSSSGLGYNLASLFIKDGFNVFINGSSSKKLSEAKAKLSTKGLVADVTKQKDCDRLIKSCEKSFGNIDILICNVGSGSSVPAGKESPDEWKRVFDINFFSTVNTIQSLLNSSQSKKTSIVCISSICGHEFIPGAPITYSASKAALNSYIKNYSKFLMQYHIRLNGIICGNILFEGSTWDKKLQEENFNPQKEVFVDVPVKRFAYPSDVFNLVKFLSKKETSFMCGSLVLLDGGQTRSL